MPVFDHTNLLCSCNTRFGLEFDTTMQKIQFLDNIELNVVEKFPFILNELESNSRIEIQY